MRRRVTSFFMAVCMMFLCLSSCLIPRMTAEATGRTVIIHYGGREDRSYQGWNIWLWEPGEEGHQIDFTKSDRFGKVAIYETTNSSDYLVFQIRLKEWEASDMEERLVTLDSNLVEIWVTSGVSEFEIVPPTGFKPYGVEDSDPVVIQDGGEGTDQADGFDAGIVEMTTEEVAKVEEASKDVVSKEQSVIENQEPKTGTVTEEIDKKESVKDNTALENTDSEVKSEPIEESSSAGKESIQTKNMEDLYQALIAEGSSSSSDANGRVVSPKAHMLAVLYILAGIGVLMIYVVIISISSASRTKKEIHTEEVQEMVAA